MDDLFIGGQAKVATKPIPISPGSYVDEDSLHQDFSEAWFFEGLCDSSSPKPVGPLLSPKALLFGDEREPSSNNTVNKTQPCYPARVTPILGSLVEFDQESQESHYLQAETFSPDMFKDMKTEDKEEAPEEDGEVVNTEVDEENSPSDSCEDDSYVPSLYQLFCFMKQSRISMAMLQDWDKKNGLPKSHSWTMTQTDRSRRQLEEGRVLSKWDGSPLIDVKDGKAFLNRKKRKAMLASKVNQGRKQLKC